MQNIAILASGSGSNAEKIMEYFSGSKNARISVVISNNPGAGVFQRAEKYGIPCEFIPRKNWRNRSSVLSVFKRYKIQFVVLAGFLQMIPDYMIRYFGENMVNIHPALLPAYGGKGMYGMHVHRAVFENRENTSGITIHRVNEVYDDGEIIFQARCDISKSDLPQDIQRKVQVLEHRYFPIVINYLVSSDNSN